MQVLGFVRMAGSSPSVTLFTPLGDMSLAKGCTELSGAGIDALAAKGWMTLSQVRGGSQQRGR